MNVRLLETGLRCVAAAVLAWLVVAPLSACAPISNIFSESAAGADARLFVPLQAQAADDHPDIVPVGKARRRLMRQKRARPTPPDQVQVWLYASLASQAQLMRLGSDPGSAMHMWEYHLHSQKIVYQRIHEAAQIDQAPIGGVLLLPSSVVLLDDERRAILAWRNRGGSVLSTWLTAAYEPDGRYVGDAFMREGLDVRVAGNTQGEPDDVFMVAHGQSPVAHSLPTGQRVWLERVAKQLPLRLVGGQAAAHIQNWSRSVDATKPTGLIVFNERKMPSGTLSRVVSIGYPEQNWLRSDPKQLRAMTDDVLTWLLRQPSAYAAAWPAPAQSALVFAVQAAEPLGRAELDLGKAYRQMGARATYFVESSNVAQALPVLKPLQALGHEVAYLGDTFDSFADQTAQVQAKRLNNAQTQLHAAGVQLGEPPGFAAPMDGYDATTRHLLLERGFGHYLTFMETSDSTLPFIEHAPGRADAGTVVLPRTLIGPEEALTKWGEEAGMTNFMAAQDLLVELGGLTVVRLPSSPLMRPEQIKQITDRWAQLRSRLWMAAAREVADWWRVRDGVRVALVAVGANLRLRVELARALPKGQRLRVWINLPHAGQTVRVQPLGKPIASLQWAQQDTLRAAFDLSAVRAGVFEWGVHFHD